MKPPICELCGTDFMKNMEGGGLVTFQLNEEEKAFNDSMMEKRIIGHPKGKYWFCPKHYQKAIKLKHLSWEEARKKMRMNPWWDIKGRLFG